MDDVSRAYFEMYGYTVANEMVSHDGEVKYQLLKEEVDTEAIKERIHKAGKEASNPERTRKDVEKLHDKRRKDVNKLLRKEYVIKEVKTTYLPKSRERDIGKHDDWKDPHPDTIDWGEKSPKAKKLVRRAVAVIGTQRRQDKEVGLRKEEMELIISYLLENGYADSIEDAEDLIEELNEEEINSICEEVYEAFVPLDGEKEGLVHAKLGDLSRQNKSLLARAKKLKAKPFSRYRPGVKRELQDVQTRAHKNLKLAKNAANALTQTNQQKIDASNARSEDLKKKILHLKPKNKIVKLNREEHDIYDLVLEYLLENGYADNEKSAQNIMEAMSENWLATILDETLS